MTDNYTNIEIQIQNISGTWFTIQTVPNQQQMITMALKNAAALYKKKVRAITASGSLVDISM
jgi:hypothetical protein